MFNSWNLLVFLMAFSCNEDNIPGLGQERCGMNGLLSIRYGKYGCWMRLINAFLHIREDLSWGFWPWIIRSKNYLMAKPLCDCRHGWSLCNIAIPTTAYHGDHSLRGLVKTRNGFEHILKGIRGMRIIHHDQRCLHTTLDRKSVV